MKRISSENLEPSLIDSKTACSSSLPCPAGKFSEVLQFEKKLRQEGGGGRGSQGRDPGGGRSRVREKERGQSAKTVAEMKEGGKRLCSHPSQISIPRSCTFYFFRNYDLFSEPPLEASNLYHRRVLSVQFSTPFLSFLTLRNNVSRYAKT